MQLVCTSVRPLLVASLLVASLVAGSHLNIDDRNNEDVDDYLPDDGELFEGDIVMDERMRALVRTGRTDSEGKRAYLTGDYHSTWPNGMVPYTFHDSLLPEVKSQVIKGIEEYNKYTCIRWVPKKAEHTDFVTFKSKKHSCSSTVGKKGGEQFISLAHGCRRIGTVVHEMMHVLDFVHEHTRPDRDDFIEVRFSHIKDGLEHNFQKYDFMRSSTDDLPYNYNSVMHYSNTAFSKDDEDTLVSKVDSHLKFGQRKQFSCLDIKEINSLYKCQVDSKLIDEYCKTELYKDMTARDVEEQRDHAEQRSEELRAEKYWAKRKRAEEVRQDKAEEVLAKLMESSYYKRQY